MNFIMTKKSFSQQEVEERLKKRVAIEKFMLRHSEELKAKSLS